MPENDIPNPTFTRSFIEAVNQSYSHLFRTLIFFILIFAFLLAAIIIFFKSIAESAELKAEFKADGGLIFEFKKSKLFSEDEKRTFATFLLPSNLVWYDTGLELEPNQECKFRISGSAHLAVHTVVKNADSDSRNPIPWTNANGNDWVNIGDVDSQLLAKKELLLKPGNKIGNILAFYIPINETKDFKQYFVQKRSELTSKIWEVNNENVIPNTTNARARIYLSVNDILLDLDTAKIRTSELAYRGNDTRWIDKWKDIRNSKYDNLYFDDNIGSFLVQVEIAKKN